jgi:PadR family transcriptional regulator, regulatory protein PadR
VPESPPLREPTYLVMTALLSGPLHGYGIIKAVERLSEGRVRLRAGTLYSALERLEHSGYLALDHEEAQGGPTRRCYCLTAAGHDLLQSEAKRMYDNARLVRDAPRRVAPEPT